jgi:glutamine amidotransferase-like uncharacterized protein
VVAFWCVLVSLAVVGCRPADKEGSAPPQPDTPDLIRAGVFTGNGASTGCVTDTVESLRIDAGIAPLTIGAADIVAGGLDEVDVLVIPGGGGSRQVGNLGDMGVAMVRDFVLEDGKGIVGICAGAYALSDTPDYACLHLSPMQAIDMEHDERGHGIVAFSVTKEGGDMFPELSGLDTAYLHYYEGPLLVPASGKKQTCEVLGTIQSDVALQGEAPTGMTPGKPMFLSCTAGRGRVFLSIAHPETTPGMRWIVPRMVRWVAGKEPVSYPRAVVRPEVYDKEILFDQALREEERKLLQTLLYGSSDDKIRAIERLVAIRTWQGRLWIPGLLRDDDLEVRLAAARALVELEATQTIADIRAVISATEDPEVVAALQGSLSALEAMVGG